MAILEPTAPDDLVSLTAIRRDATRTGVVVIDTARTVTVHELDHTRSGKDAFTAIADEGRIVGYATAHLDGPRAHLDAHNITGDLSGCGVDTKLLDGAVAWARHRDARTLTVDVPTGDQHRIELYRSRNFAITGVRPDHQTPGFYVLRMTATLAGGAADDCSTNPTIRSRP